MSNESHFPLDLPCSEQAFKDQKNYYFEKSSFRKKVDRKVIRKKRGNTSIAAASEQKTPRFQAAIGDRN